MVTLETTFGWSVTMTESQYVAGMMAARTSGCNHHEVWKALRDAGIPVRSGKKFPASHAATAIVDSILTTARGVNRRTISDNIEALEDIPEDLRNVLRSMLHFLGPAQ